MSQINPLITPTAPAGWSPDVTAFHPGDVVPDALIRQVATVVGSIEGDRPSVRVPFMADDGEPEFVDEGDPIPFADQTAAETVIGTHKLATVGRYSRELLQQDGAARMVATSLSRAIVTKANTAFLSHAEDPTGVLNATGILDGGTVETNLDPLVDAVATIEANGGNPTHVIASPDAWAYLAKLKVGTGSEQSLLGGGTQATERTLGGLPVLVTPAMPTASLLVVDRSQIVAAESGVEVARSEDVYFVNDLVAVRVTWRIGWALMRPNRVAKLTVDTDEDPGDN